MRDRFTGDFAGVCGIHEPDWTTPKFMIGYWLAPMFVGRGMASDATRLLTEFGFEHLRAERLDITCDADNTRSAAVRPRAGYVLEGRLCAERRNMAGEPADTLMFGLSSARWLAAATPRP